MSKIPAEFQQIISELSQSEAGRALAALGFRPEHQGGGQFNFERVLPSSGGLVREIVCSTVDGDAPVSLLEPVEVHRFCDHGGRLGGLAAMETRASLADWLAP
jgi:hypothetical protein